MTHERSADAGAPRVTVLLPAHNAAAFIDDAVGSILAQQFADFELLIVDDASTDGTRDKIAAWRDSRVRVVTNETNAGLTASLNRGLSLARGAFVARQDADDVSRPGRLGRQLEFMEANPRVCVLGTQVRVIGANGAPVWAAPWPKSTSSVAILWQLMFDSPFVHSSVMFRRDAIWGELRGYDETFVTSQDFELWSRVAAARYPMRNLADTLVDFRVHGASVSTRYVPEAIDKVKTVLIANLRTIGGCEDPPAGWPDAWIRATNPGTFAERDNPGPIVTRAIEAIYHSFAGAHPEAAGNPEIQRHIAAMFIRLASTVAVTTRVGSFAPFAHAFGHDVRVAASAAPRYLAALAVGGRRRRHRAADSGWHS